jgi:predicted ATPase
VLAWDRNVVPQEQFPKLEEALARHPWPLPEVVPLLAALLSLPLPAPYPPLTLTPERQKQKTLEALLAWLLAETEQQPVLFIVEDLHWVDPSTLEWLSLVVEQSPTARLYGLFTCRPEFAPPWPIRAHLPQLTLSRLPRPQVARLVHGVTRGKPLPAEVLAQIVVKTDGIPLFVEELTKTVLESGLLKEVESAYELAGPLPLLAIPTTLQDSLMARLDRLATVKAVAQLGATIGRQFGYELLRAVSPLDDAALQQHLRRLVEAELVYQRGVPPQATYLFKHALIQDAAYQSLLKSTRQQYHQRIAQVLAERFPETTETQPELLAHHYTEAGISAQAVGYWQRAGERAAQRSAHVEAISHLTKGLEVLKTLPDTPERTQQELISYIALGAPLMAIKGYAAPEVEQCYKRAWELSRQVGESPQLFPVLWGLHRFSLLRSELQTVRELGGQLLSLAQRIQDPSLFMEAHRALSQTFFWPGEFLLAQAHLEQGMALYDPQKHRSHAFLYGRDPGMDCYAYASLALWLLGYPDQALQRNQESLTLAQALSHPFSLVFALEFSGYLHHFRREGQTTRERAEAAIALSTEHKFAHFLAMGTILRGWALAEQGQEEEGIAQMHQGLGAWRATGAELARPYFLALLAEMYGKAKQAEEGLTVLAEALAQVHKTGEHFYEAELYRLQGELLLMQALPDEQQVETCFRQALDIARHQQAKSLELRAAMSLGRLWQRQGKIVHARQLLTGVYAWFTEGFDTADLQEAQALLEQWA